MFTGIVEERGTVRELGAGPAGTRLSVACRTVVSDASVGDSIAVNGVCLTVVEREDESLSFDLAPETLSRSTLGALEKGDPVNLERPLTPSSRLGGHVVQGHVDGVGEVADVRTNGDGAVMTVRPPATLGRYVAEKGSVALDGVSLTVATVRDRTFSVALIPHTLAATTLGARRPGDRVNLEVDVMAKYLERLVRRES